MIVIVVTIVVQIAALQVAKIPAMQVAHLVVKEVAVPDVVTIAKRPALQRAKTSVVTSQDIIKDDIRRQSYTLQEHNFYCDQRLSISL